VILSSVIFSYGQENSFINFTVADGLPSNEVYHVIQDKKGFIWFATDNGVVRFDGGDFEVMNTRQGLSDPVVFGFHEDDMGRIWFRTFTGKLSYYQNGKIHKYKYNDSIVHIIGISIISDMYYNSQDQLWFTAGNLTTTIDKSGNATTEKTAGYTVNLRQLNQEKDILSYSGPIHQIKNAQIANKRFPINLSDTSRYAGSICHIQWANRKYISINKDLFEYDIELKRVFIAETPIISLSVDKDNKLWIGCHNGGVQRIEDNDFNKAFSVKELKEKSVTKVFQDNEKGFWITTLEKGIFYFPNFSISKLNLHANSKISSVNSLDGKIFTTDYSGKLTAYDSKDGNKIIWEKDFGMPINTSYISELNQLWVSCSGETNIVNERGEIIEKNQPIGFIDISATSTRIYAINSSGIYKFNPQGEFQSKKHLNSRFRNLNATGKEILMGGKNGLFLFDSTFNYIREINEFKDIKVSGITPMPDSVFLISTIGNGFILFDKKRNEKVTTYNITSGFIANNIYCVLKLDSTVWLGTEKGIAITDIHSLLSGKPKFNFITKYSGLVSDKVNFLASTTEKIWAFYDEGIIQLPLNQLRFINQQPDAYIKEVKINNSAIDIKEPLNFTYEQNNIQIKIGFLSFSNQNIFARFRLSPDEPWVIPGNWTFAINELKPGQYKFQAEYSTDNLNWVLAPVDISFQIHPPWWNTWYFRISTVILVILIGIFIYRRSVTHYKEKNTYLQLINEQQKKLLNAEIETTERERSRIAKDLHDSIGMDLVSIKLMANQIAKKPVEKDVLEIQLQLQKTISEIQNIIYGLTPSGLKLFGLSHGLENYISMVSKNHPVEINLDFEGNEIKDQQIGAMVYRVIQELVTNSIKHSQCKVISIDIKVSSTLIQITYRDNGIGFDPDKVKPGLGLSNIRSRVESLEGDINLQSDATGTFYSINLPLKSESK